MLAIRLSLLIAEEGAFRIVALCCELLQMPASETANIQYKPPYLMRLMRRILNRHDSTHIRNDTTHHQYKPQTHHKSVETIKRSRTEKWASYSLNYGFSCCSHPIPHGLSKRRYSIGRASMRRLSGRVRRSSPLPLKLLHGRCAMYQWLIG